MVYFIIESLFLFLIIVVTFVHEQWFKENLPTGPFFHLGFSLVYIVPMIWIGSSPQHSLFLTAAIAVERFSFYNPLLNMMREKPFFYLSVNNTNPSLWDKIEIRWGKLYPLVWVLSLTIFIIFQFII